MASQGCAFRPGRPVGSVAVALSALLAALAPRASAQTIGAVANLSFGSFLSGSGGTVVVSPAGARSQSGGVLLLGQDPGTPAQLNVVGTANATYSITLPANNTVTLSDGNGHSMTVNSFVSSPPATGTLSAGGSQSIRIGATLIVGANQAPGGYSGAFSVIVNY